MRQKCISQPKRDSCPMRGAPPVIGESLAAAGRFGFLTGVADRSFRSSPLGEHLRAPCQVRQFPQPYRQPRDACNQHVSSLFLRASNIPSATTPCLNATIAADTPLSTAVNQPQWSSQFGWNGELVALCDIQRHRTSSVELPTTNRSCTSVTRTPFPGIIGNRRSLRAVSGAAQPLLVAGGDRTSRWRDKPTSYFAYPALGRVGGAMPFKGAPRARCQKFPRADGIAPPQNSASASPTDAISKVIKVQKYIWGAVDSKDKPSVQLLVTPSTTSSARLESSATCAAQKRSVSVGHCMRGIPYPLDDARKIENHPVCFSKPNDASKERYQVSPAQSTPIQTCSSSLDIQNQPRHSADIEPRCNFTETELEAWSLIVCAICKQEVFLSEVAKHSETCQAAPSPACLLQFDQWSVATALMTPLERATLVNLRRKGELSAVESIEKQLYGSRHMWWMPGTFGFVVQSRWLREWRKFVGTAPKREASFFALLLADPEALRPPGPINNSGLFDLEGDVVPGMKEGMKADYVVIHECLWHFFRKIYGGGPVMLRYTSSSTAMPSIYDSKATFVGEFRDGRPHTGKGHAKDDLTGFWFEGELRDGFLYNASGCGMTATGSHHNGRVVNGLPENQGRLVTIDGSILEALMQSLG